MHAIAKASPASWGFIADGQLARNSHMEHRQGLASSFLSGLLGGEGLQATACKQNLWLLVAKGCLSINNDC